MNHFGKESPQLFQGVEESEENLYGTYTSH